MINKNAIIFCSLSIVLLLLFFICLFILLKKKFQIKFLPILVGFSLFILFALLLEPLLHQLVLKPSSNGTIALKNDNPVLYMLYAAFAAGIFEEVSRYLGLTLLKKKYPEQTTSIAYGFGHGSAELILVGIATLISNLVLMVSINQNNRQIIDALPQTTIDTLINTPSSYYLLTFVERVPVMIIQILLTIIVWHGIKHANSLKVLPLAIVIHAVIDLISAGYQVGYLQNILIVYALIYLATLLLFVVTKKYFWSGNRSFTKENKL